MAQINTDLETLKTTRDNMKTALEGKGQTVSTDIRTYATAISNIDTSSAYSYSDLFSIASNIYNPNNLPDDSATVVFNTDEEQKCLQKALKIERGGI